MIKKVISVIICVVVFCANSLCQTIDDVPVFGDEFEWWTSQYLWFDGTSTETLKSPWLSPNNSDLIYIDETDDYLPEKGWQLVDFNLGAIWDPSENEKINGNVNSPWFILYNERSAVMRVFVFLSNYSNSYQGVSLRVSAFSNGTTIPATLNGGNNGSLFPTDKFSDGTYNSSNTSPKYIVSPNGNAQGNWTVFEFVPEHDPLIDQYGSVFLGFELHYIQSYGIQLDVGLENTAYTDDVKDFDPNSQSILSEDPNASNDTNESFESNDNTDGNGKKILGKLAKLDQKIKPNDYLENIEEASKNLDKFLAGESVPETSKVRKGLSSIIKASREEKKEGDKVIQSAGQLRNAFGVVTEVLGAVSGVAGAIDFAGTLFGFWGKERSLPIDAYAATYTQGRITGKITGEMRTESLGEVFTVRIPGSYLPSENLDHMSYYNSSLGSISIKQYPKVNKKKFLYPTVIAFKHRPNTTRGSFIEDRYFYELSISNSLTININECINPSIEDIKYAIVCDVPKIGVANYSIINGRNKEVNNFFPVLFKDEPIDGIHPYQFNSSPMMIDLEDGIAMMIGFDTNTENVEIRSEYVNASLLKQIRLRVPENAMNIRLRVKSIFSNVDDDFLVAVKDFNVTMQESTVDCDQTAFGSYVYNFGNNGDYNACQMPYFTGTPDASLAAIVHSPVVVNDIGSQEFFALHSGFYSFYNSISILPDPTAGESMILGNGVHIKARSIDTENQRYVYDGVNDLSVIHVSKCQNINTQHYRLSSSLSQENKNSSDLIQNVSIYPNPTEFILNVNFDLGINSNISIRIADIQGRPVYESQESGLEVGTHTQTINVSDLSPGIYFVRIVSNEFDEMRRVIIQ